MPARQGLVVQVPAGAEGHAEAKDVDLAIQPTMPPSAARNEPSSPPLDQNQSGVTPATQDATAPVHADREEGLPETDKVSGIQFSRTGQQTLPRKNKELDAEVMVELEAQSGYIDLQRLPRKKQGDDELEVETPPSHAHQKKLPRKKREDEELGVETLPLHVYQEKLPRKKQGDEELEVPHVYQERLPRNMESGRSLRPTTILTRAL
jgi:hypothetical protein